MASKKKKTSKKNSSSNKITNREVLEEIIRVDHAGEYGATKIYDGQIAIFGKNSKLGKTIQHMADQEKEHIEKFNELELRDALLKALKNLEKIEALVVQLYYVEELNVYEIAKILDLTNGRISQIKSLAIKKLRNEIKSII